MMVLCAKRAINVAICMQFKFQLFKTKRHNGRLSNVICKKMHM